jgi:beta-glucosidase
MNILTRSYLALVLILTINTVLVAQSTPIYQNPNASIDERVEDLLSRMTISEKIGQMTQINVDMINLDADNYAYLDTVKMREAIRNHHIGSFLNGFAISAEDWFDFTYNMQRINLEESRLGIPILYGIDHMHGASYLKGATIFPHNFNVSNTFDAEFARLTGKITALESAAVGHNWNFAPVLDIGRDPRWARFYETYGEDPLVASRLGAAYVKGIQEDADVGPYKVAATAKHFIGYSTPTSGWDRSPALIPMQNLHEFHRPSFQAAIDAGIKTVMINSGEVNGVPVHASRFILQNLLRDQMGFNGIALTDWADIIKLTGYDTVGYQQEHYHRIAHDEKEATKMSILAGIDMSMTPMSYNFVQYMHELVEEGIITEERLDESNRRILRLKFELGLFETPLPSLEYTHLIYTDEHKMAALNAARESIVVLNNENNILPLAPQTVRQIVIIGDKAASRKALNGGWTMEWQGGKEEHYPDTMPTILQAMQSQFPQASIRHLTEADLANGLTAESFSSTYGTADLVIGVVGEMPYTEFIGNINNLEIDSDQADIINLLAALPNRTGLVLVAGRPRVLPDSVDELDFVLFAGLPGFEGATAIAEILSGAVNPSGRLSFTYPKYNSHFNTYDHKPTDRATFKWPFGHGLSYSEFEYKNLKLSASELNEAGSIMAELEITNTGNRAARHAVLWFITDEIGTITRPVRKLSHFEKITLDAGASKMVRFEIKADEVLWYPDDNGNRILEPGRFILRVGDEEADFMLRR